MEALDESFPQRVYAISPGRVQIMKQFSKWHVPLTDDTCLVFLFIAACYINRASGKFDLDLQRTVKTRAAARNRKKSENVKQIFFLPFVHFPPPPKHIARTHIWYRFLVLFSQSKIQNQKQKPEYLLALKEEKKSQVGSGGAKQI